MGLVRRTAPFQRPATEVFPEKMEGVGLFPELSVIVRAIKSGVVQVEPAEAHHDLAPERAADPGAADTQRAKLEVNDDRTGSDQGRIEIKPSQDFGTERGPARMKIPD